MSKKLQFQNLMLQQALQEVEDYAQQPTVIQPALTLPIKPETAMPLPPARSFSATKIRQESSIVVMTGSGDIVSPQPEVNSEDEGTALIEEACPVPAPSRKIKVLRGVAGLLSALLVLTIFFTWHFATPTSASPAVTQQAYSGAANLQSTSVTSSTPTAVGDNGMIEVYIVGAIKHPGVYQLPADARVYQLVQAAGGTLPSANLVALNLAAKLADGQEIYVLSVGETPPENYTGASSGTSGTPTVSTGQPVNINTASETEMRQVLHVSAATAQKIIAYRTQHGPYTSVDQLLQVISKSIYDRIKGMVTI